MPSHILAIDQGTTSTRAIVFDEEARPVASAQVELEQFFPEPGWVEHDATEILGSTISVCRQAVERAGLELDEIAGIGIANQRETTVVWERDSGRPLANARSLNAETLSGSDRATRSSPFCTETGKTPHARALAPSTFCSAS